MRLTLGTPQGSGVFDSKAVAVVVTRSHDTLRDCYQATLEADPNTRATATVTFTLGRDGKVSAAKATGLPREANACLVSTVARFAFGKPSNGKPVRITYLLTYDPPATQDEPAAPGEHASLEDAFGSLPRGTGDLGDPAPTPTAPTGMVGRVAAKGSLDPEIVRRWIKRNIMKLSYCYDRELAGNTKLLGTVTTKLTIGSNGAVTSAKASGMNDKNVESCVVQVIKGIEFPKPKDGAPVAVTFPITFRPAKPTAANP